MFPHFLFPLSYILQAIGFVGIAYAWGRALQEFREGGIFPHTRLILFIITSIAFSAYVLPTLFAICYFLPGCFNPLYRDYLRLFSGLILFLYGTFTAYLYYKKEVETTK